MAGLCMKLFLHTESHWVITKYHPERRYGPISVPVLIGRMYAMKDAKLVLAAGMGNVGASGCCPGIGTLLSNLQTITRVNAINTVLPA